MVDLEHAAMAPFLLERIRDKSFLLSTLNYQLGQLLYRTGLRRHQSGTTLDRLDPERSLEYVRRVFDDYVYYGGLGPRDLIGKRSLEVGPGDSLGVALLFVAHGATQVVCLDRFQSSFNAEKQRAIYRALLSGLKGEARERATASLDESGGIRAGLINCRCGFPIETAHEHLPNGSFDLIVSRAVLEHVYDVDRAWKSMDRLLAPGGRMLHKIDFRCHGFYEALHPLWWLTVPDWLWRTVSSPDPTLNRARRPAYVRLAKETDYSCRIRITHLTTRQDELVPHLDQFDAAEMSPEELAFIEKIRPRLALPFRLMAAEDLLINGIFLTATKS
jgi:SAM-dependent methyltransferase